MMKEEGRDAIFARHSRLAKATRAASVALGLDLFASEPSEAITSIYSPANLKADAVYQGLMNMANFTVAGGQEQMSGNFPYWSYGLCRRNRHSGSLWSLGNSIEKIGLRIFSYGGVACGCDSDLHGRFFI